MDGILLEASERTVIEALEANLQAHVGLYAYLPGARVCDEPGVVGLMDSLDVSESCVYRAIFPPEQADKNIERVVQRYRSEGCLPMWWIVGPSSQPADLGKRLQEQGFECFAHPPGMAADLPALPEQAALPDRFTIERVANSRALREWAEVLGIAGVIPDALKEGFYDVFEMHGYSPGAPCRLFLGREEGKAVATSRLLCAGGVAGIWHVATLPEARGRGYGTAMTMAAARAGREVGYQVGGLFATPAGYRLYHRLGFQEICTLDVYQSPT
jgi:ribosomal protein S18 acetylase RimI-like enzyme